MIILLFGRAGSGKSTLAEKIAQLVEARIFSGGKVIRNAAQDPSNNFHHQAKEIAEGLRSAAPRGLLEIQVKMELKSYVSGKFEVLIFDNYLHSLDQVNHFKACIDELEIAYEKVKGVELCAQVDEIVKRLSGGMFCPACNQRYGSIAICPRCHTELVSRQDDSTDRAIRNRARRYDSYIPGILSYFEQHWELLRTQEFRTSDIQRLLDKAP